MAEPQFEQYISLSCFVARCPRVISYSDGSSVDVDNDEYRLTLVA